MRWKSDQDITPTFPQNLENAIFTLLLTQVITRQQKLIKKLLKKRDSSNDLFDETEVKKFAAACTTDPEMLNDSDSAIIIDVGVGELTTTGSSITGKI